MSIIEKIVLNGCGRVVTLNNRPRTHEIQIEIVDKEGLPNDSELHVVQKQDPNDIFEMAKHLSDILHNTQDKLLIAHYMEILKLM